MIDDVRVLPGDEADIQISNFIRLKRDQELMGVCCSRYSVETYKKSTHGVILTCIVKHVWDRKTGEWYSDQHPDEDEEKDWKVIKAVFADPYDWAKAIQNHYDMIDEAKKLVEEELKNEES